MACKFGICNAVYGSLLEQTSGATSDGQPFRLPESVAIFSYLTTVYGHLQRKIPDHWYPQRCPKARARVESALHWYHTTLRAGCTRLMWNKVVAARLGMQGSEALAQDGLAQLKLCLPQLESVWLPGPGPYLCGNDRPSVADVLFCCELEQLTMLNNDKHGVDMASILEPHPRIRQWMRTVAQSVAPHYERVHAVLRKAALASGGTLSPAQEAPTARL